MTRDDRPDPMGPLIDDLVAEQNALDAALAAVPEADWARPSPAEGWLLRDCIAHLAQGDEMARRVAETREPLSPTGGGTPSRDALHGRQVEARALSVPELLDWWRRERDRLRRRVVRPRGYRPPGQSRRGCLLPCEPNCSRGQRRDAVKGGCQVPVKVIIQLYPVMPAADEADRRARRPLGRDRDLYHKVVHGMTDIIKAADDLGFWGVTEIEHHLHSEGYEIGPSPGILNAYWASQVKNLRMGQLGYVMSTQHPLRVAEETAILDHLTHGRFFVGFARGYQSRWTEILGQHYGTRATVAGLADPGAGQIEGADAAQRAADDDLNRRIFEDQVELVVKAWTQDLVRHDGEFFQVPFPYAEGVRGYPAADTAAEFGVPGEVGADGEIRGVAVTPAPYQRPHPPVFISSAASLESVAFAAKRGFNVGHFVDIDKLEERAQHYVSISAAAGRTVRLGQGQANIRWLHFGADEAEFDDQLRRYDLDIYKNFYSRFFTGSHFDYGQSEREWLDSIKTSGLFFGGSSDDVKRTLVAEWERVPSEYLIIIWHYAQQPKDDVIREMRVFMEDVYPEIRDAYPD